MYTFSIGLPGGGNVPLVGPVDIALPYFLTMANGALPGSGDLIFVQPVPVTPALMGMEFVYQAAAVDGSSPTGFGVSNPVRVEIAPPSSFAFAEVPTAMPILPVANGMEPVVGDVANGDGDGGEPELLGGPPPPLPRDDLVALPSPTHQDRLHDAALADGVGELGEPGRLDRRARLQLR